ncbi:MAG TPA: hypothetical protein VM010_07005 [Chitinophagaceae bacterium]|nr:hypothetical protein [Chitinophagaceae bacterium]
MLPNTLPAIKEGLSKKQITALVNQSVDSVLESGNAAQVAELLSVMDEFVKGIRKDDRFVDGLRDELLKAHGSIKTASGARIEACEAGIQYDYSENPAWTHVNNQIAELTEQRKSLEQKLRSIPGGKMVVDEETGEVFIGAFKTSKSTYRITLAR